MTESMLSALLASVVPSVIGFFAVRSFKSVDTSLAMLGVKVDRLNEVDTKLSIELAELRVRITNLEFMVQERIKPKPQGRAK